MSIRITALYLLVGSLVVYAWKDWFKSLCGLILLMAVMKHPDMPSKMFGIQGMNPWNFLFVVVFFAWIANRRQEGLTWDMPNHISLLLLMYVGVIIVGVLRAVFDRSHIEYYPLSSLISEELINSIKWIIPGLLLFDGARTRSRVLMALVCLLAFYFLTAVQVVRYMPFTALVDSGVMNHARIGLGKYMGYSAPDIGTMLAGAGWGMLAVLPLVRKRIWRIAVLAAAGVIFLGQALTGGRMGYVGCGIVGLILCLIKWRKYLLLFPVAIVLLPVVFPGAAERMLQGFDQTDVTGQTTIDRRTVSSGRLVIWPYVIDEICASPLIGYGRLAMQRTGLSERIEAEGIESGFPHPHNMYLETLLDNGLIGSLPIFLFWSFMVVYSIKLFVNPNNLYSAVGGLSLSLAMTSLVTGLGGQHVYPQEQTFGIWTGIFLSLRIYVEEKTAQTAYIVADSYSCGRTFAKNSQIAELANV